MVIDSLKHPCRHVAPCAPNVIDVCAPEGVHYRFQAGGQVTGLLQLTSDAELGLEARLGRVPVAVQDLGQLLDLHARV